MVVGNAKTLKKSDFWGSLVENCRGKQKEGGFFTINQQIRNNDAKVVKEVVIKKDKKAFLKELNECDILEICEESSLQVIKKTLRREGQESDTESEEEKVGFEEIKNDEEFEEQKFEEVKKEDDFGEREVVEDACKNFDWVSANQIEIEVERKKSKKYYGQKRQRKPRN